MRFLIQSIQGNIYRACKKLECKRDDIKCTEDLIKKFAEKYY